MFANTFLDKTFLLLTLSTHIDLNLSWSIPLSAMHVKVSEIGFEWRGVGHEIAWKNCMNTRRIKFIGAKAYLYLLSQCDIEDTSFSTLILEYG